MTAAQASNGTAATSPRAGTVLSTAPVIRHGAATTLQPDSTATQASIRQMDLNSRSRKVCDAG